MITRIVKMTFQEETIGAFLTVFAQYEEKIRNVEGCINMEAFRALNDRQLFFTYSLWKSEVYLENYRQSVLFKTIWMQTKPLFATPAEAYTMQKIQNTKS